MNITERDLRGLVENLMSRTYFLHHDPVPGAVIKRLQPEDKKLLPLLTSRHFSYDPLSPPIQRRRGGRWNLKTK